MKKTVVAALLAVVVCVGAQARNPVMLHFDFGLAGSSSSEPFIHTFRLTPGMSFMLDDHWSIGFDVSYQHENGYGKDINSFSAGPRAGYSRNIKGRFYYAPEIRTFFGVSFYDGDAGFFADVIFSPVNVEWRLGPGRRFGLNLSVLNMFLGTSRWKGQVSSSFDVNFIKNMGLGFRYHF